MATQSNPGPSIVAPSIIRGASVVSVDVPSVGVGAGISPVRYAVKGVLPGDVVSVSPYNAPASTVAIMYAYVDAADSVSVMYFNSTAGSVTIAANTYNMYIARGYPVVYDFGQTILNNSGIIASTSP